MMTFPGMIAEAAQRAGMKTPPDPDDKWNPDEFPHFQIFCNIQLARPITWGEHWHNAKVIAAIPENKLKTITLDDLIAKGLQFTS